MKRLSNRGCWILCGVSVVLALFSFFLYHAVSSAEEVNKAKETEYNVHLKAHQETVGKIEEMSRKARTLEDWEEVRSAAQGFPADAQAHFSRVAAVRSLELLADERDRLLANAGDLFTANESDPQVKENIARALALHERAEAIMQKLESIPGNVEWNKSLEYRKAYEKYRKLAFLDKKAHGEALDILADALSNLQKALGVAPKDNRTELAIEFLYKRAKEEEKAAGGDGQSPGRPRALPQQNGERNPGTGGDNRPRQH